MTQAFIYCRVSGLAQVEHDGFPRQIAACEKYAAANGLTVAGSFLEKGVTGKSDLDNRPALRECIAALLENGTRTLLIERLDRLARDLMIQESIIQDLTRKGITLISVAEPDLCSADPTRTLMRHILGAFFQYERTMIVAKMKAAKDRKRARGERVEGQKPFGELPGEEIALRIMRRGRDTGHSFDQIASLLNSQCRSRSGRPWRASTIQKILARSGN